MAFGNAFFTPPWMRDFGPIIGRANDQAAGTNRGGNGGGGGGALDWLIPQGFLGHLGNRNIFGRPLYQATATPDQSAEVAAKPTPGYRPMVDPQQKERFMRRDLADFAGNDSPFNYFKPQRVRDDLFRFQMGNAPDSMEFRRWLRQQIGTGVV